MEASKIETIYKLTDPFTGKVMYIGRTCVDLETRLSQHVFQTKRMKLNNPKVSWFMGVLAKGSLPVIEPVCYCLENSEDTEIFLIRLYKSKGHPLTNKQKTSKKYAKSFTIPNLDNQFA